MQGSSGWEHSVAGAVAGSAAVLLLHPFDVLKTRLQVQDGHQGQLLGTYRGTLHAVRTMLEREGWRSFYNGLVPAWLGSGVAWSAYFTAYEGIKGLYSRSLQPGERLSPLSHTLSAAQAGAMVCLLTNPIWLIKTRLQLQTAAPLPSWRAAAGSATAREAVAVAAASQSIAGASSAPSTTSSAAAAAAASQAGTSGRAAAAAAAASQLPARGALLNGAAAASGPAVATLAAASERRQYKGFVDALVCIGRQEGLRGFYKGLAPSLVLQTTHGAIQFTVYEELKHAAARWGAASDQAPDRRVGSLETSAAAALSKLTASVVTYPSQVVRSRLQQRFDLGRTRVYGSTWEVIKLTWQGEGLRGFYKGLGPALVRVMPQSAVTLVVYENVLQVLQAREQRRRQQQEQQ